MEREPRSHCPISLALEAIGDRWSLLILRDVIVRGKQRYHEFLSSEEGISTNILADRLVRLEQQGLITKSDDPDDKRQFLYSPTQKSLDLLPIIYEMGRWSAKYDSRTDVTNPFFQRMKAGKDGFMREIVARFEGSRAPIPRGRPRSRGRRAGQADRKG
jgi:DNA-binding HxlR family transcriptional regulator